MKRSIVDVTLIKIFVLCSILLSFSYIAYNHLNWIYKHKLNRGVYEYTNLGEYSLNNELKKNKKKTKIIVDANTIAIEGFLEGLGCDEISVKYSFSYEQPYLARYFLINDMLSVEFDDTVASSCGRIKYMKLLGANFGFGGGETFDIIKKSTGGDICVRSNGYGLTCFKKV